MSKNEPSHQETIENRVYLFESLAKAFIEKAADDLAGKNPDRRARALRVLADLAYVSCAVADSGVASAKSVRRKVLNVLSLDTPSLVGPSDAPTEQKE